MMPGMGGMGQAQMQMAMMNSYMQAMQNYMQSQQAYLQDQQYRAQTISSLQDQMMRLQMQIYQISAGGSYSGYNLGGPTTLPYPGPNYMSPLGTNTVVSPTGNGTIGVNPSLIPRGR